MKTTQELARELADILSADYSSLREALYDSGLKVPSHVMGAIMGAIQAEIKKEAQSLKKQLQEALAKEEA